MRSFAGGLTAFFYNAWIGKIPSRTLRRSYLKAYLARFGNGSSVQMGCRFLNGRKIFLGERNVINWGCVLDGRKFSIRTGKDVSIGPEATILTLGHDPQSPDFADQGGDVIVGDRVWIAYRATILPGVTLGEGAVVAARGPRYPGCRALYDCGRAYPRVKSANGPGTCAINCTSILSSNDRRVFMFSRGHITGL